MKGDVIMQLNPDCTGSLDFTLQLVITFPALFIYLFTTLAEAQSGLQIHKKGFVKGCHRFHERFKK